MNPSIENPYLLSEASIRLLVKEALDSTLSPAASHLTLPIFPPIWLESKVPTLFCVIYIYRSSPSAVYEAQNGDSEP